MKADKQVPTYRGMKQFTPLGRGSGSTSTRLIREAEAISLSREQGSIYQK